jgi:nucleotide-binding universal stress UspA family protein
VASDCVLSACTVRSFRQHVPRRAESPNDRAPALRRPHDANLAGGRVGAYAAPSVVRVCCSLGAHRDTSIECEERIAMFKSVVVGADDSSTARQAVIAAAEIAQLAGGKLHIVTAYDPKAVRTDDLPVEFRELGNVNPADALLEGLAKIAAQRGLEPIVHASKGGAAEAIIGVAEQEDADLIVVGNKGMKGVRRVLGSIPNSVAHDAPCSVFIVDTHEAG